MTTPPVTTPARTPPANDAEERAFDEYLEKALAREAPDPERFLEHRPAARSV